MRFIGGALICLAVGACGSSEDSSDAVAMTGGTGGIASGAGGSVSETGGNGGAAGADTGGAGGVTGPADGGMALRSLVKFIDATAVESAPRPAGRSVTIESVNGNVDVIEGASAGTVVATFDPFVLRALDTPDAEVMADFALLTAEVTTDASGNVVITTARESGAQSTLGADITVELPTDFDGALVVRQSNGVTNVGSVVDAASVDIESENGRIEAFVGVSPIVTARNAGAGSVDVTATRADSIDLESSAGDVTAQIGALVSGATGGSFVVTGLGDIALTLPRNGQFSLVATAGDAVDFGALPSACSEDVTATASKTLTCNGGGTLFTAEAAGSSLGSVTVGYN